MKTINIKTAILFLIFFLSGLMYANAQQKERLTTDSLAQHRTRLMRIVLHLDSIQTEKVAVLNRKLLRQMDDIGKSGRAGTQRLNENKDATGKYDRELKKLLTADQFRLYKSEEGKAKDDSERKLSDKNRSKKP
jgi:hypothetical protein